MRIKAIFVGLGRIQGQCGARLVGTGCILSFGLLSLSSPAIARDPTVLSVSSRQAGEYRRLELSSRSVSTPGRAADLNTVPAELSATAAAAQLSGTLSPNLLPFPLSANQRGTVTCIENPSVSYDIYLPPAYSGTSNPLPIVYTLSPGGGGMVSDFLNVSGSMNFIDVGILGSSNGATYDEVLKEFYAVSRDIRQRVLFDPTAVIATGLSGGGENAYVYSRFASQLTSGVLAMGGWLGCYYGYYSTFGVQSGLLVARTTGNTDVAAASWLSGDGYFLTYEYNATVNDWTFTGGHEEAPDSVKEECISWILSSRVPPGTNDEQNALAQAAVWRSQAAAGQTGAVVQACMTALMSRPRTWIALESQLVLDDLMKNYSSIAPLNVSGLGTGDFASDLFYYYGRGVATNGDTQLYYSSLKLMTGVTGTSGARAGDLYILLGQSGYPTPTLQLSLSNNLVNLWIDKNTPGLSYSLQSSSNLQTTSWSATTGTPSQTNTTWSDTTTVAPGAESAFYQAVTAAVSGTSPPWPY